MHKKQNENFICKKKLRYSKITHNMLDLKHWENRLYNLKGE